MLRETRLKRLIIEADSASEWEREYNERTQGLEIVKEEWNMGRGTHCLYVQYKEEITTPTSTEDEYYLKGERYKCAECPYFEPPLNYTMKRCGCKLKGYTTKDAWACEPFYRQLKAGRFKVGATGTFEEVE